MVSGTDLVLGTLRVTSGLRTGTLRVLTNLSPEALDGAALGTTALQWSDLFLAEGAAINWDNGDVTLIQTGNALAIAGGDLVPGTTDTVSLGTTALNFSDLFLDSGAVINFDSGDVTLTHGANLLTLGGGNFALGTNAISSVGAVTSSGAISSSSATAGIGYATGAGGTITQLTNKATTVELNTVCGTITMNNAALGADTTVAFTLTNSAIAATDVVVVVHDSVGTLGAYSFGVTPAAGSALISVHNNTPGILSEAIVLRFAVIKAVVA